MSPVDGDQTNAQPKSSTLESIHHCACAEETFLTSCSQLVVESAKDTGGGPFLSSKPTPTDELT
jgi:hypothetical protein